MGDTAEGRGWQSRRIVPAKGSRRGAVRRLRGHMGSDEVDEGGGMPAGPVQEPDQLRAVANIGGLWA